MTSSYDVISITTRSHHLKNCPFSSSVPCLVLLLAQHTCNNRRYGVSEAINNKIMS